DVPIYFDDTPIATDEIAALDLDHAMLATMTTFALSIREHRRDSGAIREKLLSYLFTITPAECAAILPPIGNGLQFDPMARAKRKSGPIRPKQAIVEQVARWSKPIVAGTSAYLHMRAFHSQQGVIYVRTSGGKRFDGSHLERLIGVA